MLAPETNSPYNHLIIRDEKHKGTHGKKIHLVLKLRIHINGLLKTQLMDIRVIYLKMLKVLFGMLNLKV
ncbi:MAG: hypothetical protein D3910_21880 [Candidatus Electrothrix sp. ATG2]|nr:hypothetical protein [Candidatus Electrothrix sp. ATG2]